MRVSACRFQLEVTALAGLDREAEKTAFGQRASHCAKHLGQVAEIHQHITGDDEIESSRTCPQVLGQLAADEIVVDLTLLRDLEHP